MEHIDVHDPVGIVDDAVALLYEACGAELSPMVLAAVEVAIAAHDGQCRRTGEAYVCHPLAVATTVARLGFDDPCVAAAVCHDVVEDTEWTSESLARRLGPEVAALVEGVTKIERVTATSTVTANSSSMAKFLVAATNDVRVLVIKLADRLHNLTTASVLSEEQRRRSASEALEVFSPLAHRLGLDELRIALEDLAFEVLYPEVFAATSAALAEHATSRDEHARSVVARLHDACEAAGIQATLEWRVKHLWSAYRKSVRTDTDVTALPDLIGVRVIVPSIADCYRTLGVVHGVCTPLPGRFKDLIAMPRPTGYRSLHTTVLVDAIPLEVQIRTEAMHLQARFGVAAHYRYKEGRRRRGSASTGRFVDDELVETLANAASPEEFLETLRQDLVPTSTVLVLTPAGEPMDLPAGASVIDFAYKVHSDIGHRCTGARVNGRLVPIRTRLRTGDVVEVLTGPSAAPRRDWLDHVVTSRARAKIRKHLVEQRSDRVAQVTAELHAELRARGADPHDAATVGRICRMNGVDSLVELALRLVEQRRSVADVQGLTRRRRPTTRRTRPREAAADNTTDITTELRRAVAGLPCAVAACCAPTSLADASAYVTPSRSVSVHVGDCPNYRSVLRMLPSNELTRILDLDPDRRRAVLEVTANDRAELYDDCLVELRALAATPVAVTAFLANGRVVLRLEVAATTDVFADVVRAVQEVDAVVSVVLVRLSAPSVGA